MHIWNSTAKIRKYCHILPKMPNCQIKILMPLPLPDDFQNCLIWLIRHSEMPVSNPGRRKQRTSFQGFTTYHFGPQSFRSQKGRSRRELMLIRKNEILHQKFNGFIVSFMASQSNIYSQLVISLIRISDITNYNSDITI